MIDTSVLVSDVVADLVFSNPSASYISVKLPSMFEAYNFMPDADNFLPGLLLQITTVDYIQSVDAVGYKFDSTKSPISFTQYNDSDNFRMGPVIDMVGYEYAAVTTSSGTQTVRQFWSS